MALEDLNSTSSEIRDIICTLETMKDEMEECETEFNTLTEQNEAFCELEGSIDDIDTYLINNEAKDMPEGLFELLTKVVKDFNTIITVG